MSRTMFPAAALDPRWSFDNIPVLGGTAPVYGFGSLYFAATDGQLHAVDFQSGLERWVAPNLGPSSLRTPVRWGSVLLVTDSGANVLYAVDAVTGNTNWSVSIPASGPLSAPCAGTGAYPANSGDQALIPMLYLSDGSNIYSVALPDDSGHSVTTIYTSANPGSIANGIPPLFDSASRTILFLEGQNLTALQPPPAGVTAWSAGWQTAVGNSPTPPVAGQGRVYVANSNTNSATVMAIDIVTGLSLSSPTLSTAVNSALCFDGSLVYVPGAAGTLFALDPSELTESWNQTPGGPLTTSPISSDGMVYVGSGDGNLYALDIASGGGSGVSLTVGDALQYVAKVSNGTVYFGTQSLLMSQNLQQIERQFLVRSELIEQMEPGLSNAPLPTATYRTEVSVFHVDKTARVNESVKIWASEPVTITIGGQVYSIDAHNPVALQTDSSGQISMSVAANPAVQAGSATGLATPSLKVWGDFMNPGERVLMYPDQPLHHRLSVLSGDQLLAAHSYNAGDLKSPGDALIPSVYQTSEAASAIASTVNNAIGLQQSASNAGAANRYLAYPGTMQGVFYQPQDAPAFRPAPAGNWQLTIPANQSAPTFQNLSSTQAFEIAQNLGHGPSALPESFWGDLEDFADDVVNGVEQVATLVWNTIEGAVTATIQSLEKGWKFVVNTVEDAVTVLAGVFKSIGAAIEKVIEALSLIFSWNDILKIQQKLVNQVNNAFSDAIAAVETVKADANQLLQSWTGQVNGLFTWVENQVQSWTFASARGAYTDPSTPFSAGGNSNNSVPGQWALRKLQEHVQASSGSASAALRYRLALGPTAGGQDPLVAAFDTFVTDLVSGIANVAEALPAQVTGLLDQLGGMLSDPSTFLNSGVKALLMLLNDIVDDCLAVAQVVLDALLDLIAAVLALVQEMLTATIPIPVLSDLFQTLTGSPMTLLDVSCLVIAIPVQIISAGLSSNAPAPLAAAPASADKDLAIGYTVTGLCYSIFDCLADSMDPITQIVRSIAIGFTAVEQALASPFLGQTSTLRTITWIYQWLPAIRQAKSIRDVASAVDPIGPAWDGTYGLCHLLLLGVCAGVDQDYYWNNGQAFAQNMLGAIPETAKYIGLSENEYAMAALMTIDLFGDIASALISALNWMPRDSTAVLSAAQSG